MWQVYLKQALAIEQVTLWHRTDSGLQSRLNGAIVKLLDADRNVAAQEVIADAPKASRKIVFQDSQPIELREAFADYAQSGFAASSVVDNDKATGWAVGGDIVKSHLLTAVPKQPIELKRGGKLRLQIEHASTHRHHLLGSFELLATTDKTAREWSMMTVDMKRSH